MSCGWNGTHACRCSTEAERIRQCSSSGWAAGAELLIQRSGRSASGCWPSGQSGQHCGQRWGSLGNASFLRRQQQFCHWGAEPPELTGRRRPCRLARRRARPARRCESLLLLPSMLMTDGQPVAGRDRMLCHHLRAAQCIWHGRRACADCTKIDHGWEGRGQFWIAVGLHSEASHES